MSPCSQAMETVIPTSSVSFDTLPANLKAGKHQFICGSSGNFYVIEGSSIEFHPKNLTTSTRLTRQCLYCNNFKLQWKLARLHHVPVQIQDLHFSMLEEAEKLWMTFKKQVFLPGIHLQQTEPWKKKRKSSKVLTYPAILIPDLCPWPKANRPTDLPSPTSKAPLSSPKGARRQEPSADLIRPPFVNYRDPPCSKLGSKPKVQWQPHWEEKVLCQASLRAVTIQSLSPRRAGIASTVRGISLL